MTVPHELRVIDALPASKGGEFPLGFNLLEAERAAIDASTELEKMMEGHSIVKVYYRGNEQDAFFFGHIDVWLAGSKGRRHANPDVLLWSIRLSNWGGLVSDVFVAPAHAVSDHAPECSRWLEVVEMFSRYGFYWFSGKYLKSERYDGVLLETTLLDVYDYWSGRTWWDRFFERS